MKIESVESYTDDDKIPTSPMYATHKYTTVVNIDGSVDTKIELSHDGFN